MKPKTLKINPQPGIVYIQTESVSAGSLDTSSRDSAVEFAEVVAFGKGVENLSIGDKIFYKAWAVDTVTHEGIRYNFINTNSGGILAVIK